MRWNGGSLIFILGVISQAVVCSADSSETTPPPPRRPFQRLLFPDPCDGALTAAGYLVVPTTRADTDLARILEIPGFNASNRIYGPEVLDARLRKTGMTGGQDVYLAVSKLDIPRRADLNFLVLGGGTGRDTALLLELFPNATFWVVEHHPESAEFLRNRFGSLAHADGRKRVNVVADSILNARLTPNFFHVAFGFASFPLEFAPGELLNLFTVTRRSLVRGGRLVLDIPDPDSQPKDGVVDQVGKWEVARPDGQVFVLRGFLYRPDQVYGLGQVAGFSSSWLEPWNLAVPAESGSKPPARDVGITSRRDLICLEAR